MKEDLFDEKIKKLVDDLPVSVDMAMFDQIQKGVANRRKFFIYKIVSMSAVAALLAVGLFISIGRGKTSDSTPQVVAVVPQEDSSDPCIYSDSTAYPGSISPSVSTKPLMAEVVVKEHPKPVVFTKEVYAESAAAAVSCVGENDPKERQSVVDEARNGEELNDYSVSSENALLSENRQTEDTQSIYGDENYFEEPDVERRKSGSFSLSVGGDLSAINPASSYQYYPGPSFVVGGGQGAVNNRSVTPTSSPHHFLPLSAGINLTYSFLNNKLAVGLGLNYTYLFSEYEALIDRSIHAYVEQSIQYIGLPITVYYNIIGNEKLAFYASLGGTVERALKISYDAVSTSGTNIDRYRKPEGVQWSVNAGIGFEYRFVKFMGLYIDPRLTYYFDNPSQPLSVRTEQPLQFNFEVGLRFHI